jgi:hypothetical protein
MKLNLRRSASLAVAGALTLGLAGVTALPATAAAPTTATIRLITPTLTSDNSLERGDLETLFTVDNAWYAPGIRFHDAWAPAGSTINLVYHVTADSAGTIPLVNTPVTLRVGKSYSISTALITIDGKSTNMDKGAGAEDQLNVVHNTDMYGNVSFTMQTSANDNDNLKPASAAPATPQDKPEGGGKDLYTQIYPQVVNQAVDIADMTEFHFYTGDIASTTPAKADIRMSSPVLTDSNSLKRPDLEKTFSVDNNWYQPGITFRNVWQTIGSAFNLSYHVADGDGKAVRGATFKLHVNKGYSNSTANVTDGTTAAGPVTGGDDGAVWTTTTDAFGNVLFNFQNTNTTGGEPAAATDAAGVLAFDKGGLFSQIYPDVLGQAVDSADMTEIHYLAKPVVVPPAVAKVAISASGRTIKVTLTNAKGKAAKITITGLKAVTKTASKNTATVYSFKVTKGKKTVKVVVGGKTTSKSLTIK